MKETSEQSQTESPTAKTSTPSGASKLIKQIEAQQQRLKRLIIGATIAFVAGIGLLLWYSVGASSFGWAKMNSCAAKENRNSRRCADQAVQNEAEWRTVGKDKGSSDNFTFSLGK